MIFILVMTFMYILLEKANLLTAYWVSNLSLRTLFLSFFVVFPLIFLTNHIGILKQLSVKYYTSIGNITYAVYMIHFPVQLLFSLLIPKVPHSVLFSQSFFIGFLAFNIGAGAFVYYFFEVRVKLFLRNTTNHMWA